MIAIGKENDDEPQSTVRAEFKIDIVELGMPQLRISTCNRR